MEENNENNICKGDLEEIKEYYHDIFPDDVNESLEEMIDKEIKKQETKINSYKNIALINLGLSI